MLGRDTRNCWGFRDQLATMLTKKNDSVKKQMFSKKKNKYKHALRCHVRSRPLHRDVSSEDLTPSACQQPRARKNKINEQTIHDGGMRQPHEKKAQKLCKIRTVPIQTNILPSRVGAQMPCTTQCSSRRNSSSDISEWRHGGIFLSVRGDASLCLPSPLHSQGGCLT